MDDGYIKKSELEKELIKRGFYPAIVKRALERMLVENVREEKHGHRVIIKRNGSYTDYVQTQTFDDSGDGFLYKKVSHFYKYGMPYCSECGAVLGDLQNYCGKCGAIIDGEDEDVD